MSRLLFICYGNICRSPFAEVYARQRAKELGLAEIVADSAGIGATPGTPSPNNAIKAARELGVDLRTHRAKLLRDLNIESTDQVIAMDRYVFGNVAESLGPTLDTVKGPAGSHLTLMMQATDDAELRSDYGLDIPDPMGGPVSDYQKTYRLLMQTVDALLENLS